VPAPMRHGNAPRAEASSVARSSWGLRARSRRACCECGGLSRARRRTPPRRTEDGEVPPGRATPPLSRRHSARAPDPPSHRPRHGPRSVAEQRPRLHYRDRHAPRASQRPTAVRAPRSAGRSARRPPAHAATPRPASCSPPAPTPMSSRSTSAIRPTRSPRTSTAMSRRSRNVKPPTGSTLPSTGDGAVLDRVAVPVVVLTQEAGRPLRATRL
jgi:hypothetical protein